MAFKALFEHITCGRCGGSGRYSFNLMHGSTCYGCNGLGVKLTRRGQEAQRYLDDLRSVALRDVKIGDLVRADCAISGRRWFARVSSITLHESGSIEVMTKSEKHGGYGWNCSPDYKIRRGLTAEEKETTKAAALAYQSTLTKAGVPAKR